VYLIKENRSQIQVALVACLRRSTQPCVSLFDQKRFGVSGSERTTGHRHPGGSSAVPWWSMVYSRGRSGGVLQAMLGVVVVLMALASGSVLSGADPQQSERDARRIYDRLLAAVPPGRPPPGFAFGRAPGPRGLKVAYYLPEENLIVLEPLAYQVCERLDPGAAWVRDSAVALVLGHELAHFAQGHGWEKGFLDHATGLGRDTTTVRAVPDSADYLGGMFAYIAGYEPFAVAPRLVEALYTAFGLGGDEGRGSPRQVRLATLESARASIEDVLPWYKAARLLLMADRPLEAARLFDHVAVRVPSRVVLNNAGVAWASAAIAAMRPAPLFRMPFELGWDERISPRGGLTRGQTVLRVEASALLERARQIFAQIDAASTSGDLGAQISLSSVYSLLGDVGLAEAFASRALAEAKRRKDRASAAHALVARAVARLTAKPAQTGKARRDLIEASALGATLADLNLRILDRRLTSEAGSSGCAVPPSAASDEGIPKDSPARAGGADASTSLVLPAGHSCRVDALACPRIDLSIEADSTRRWERARIDVNGRTLVRAESTGAQSDFPSARGVRRGAPATALAPYGCPTRVIAHSGGEIRIFEVMASGRPAVAAFDVVESGLRKVEGWSFLQISGAEF
jgi:hypothetical protein